MNDLWLWLWLCEELTGDKICPRNALLTQLMGNNQLDETMMTQAPELLSWGLPLKHRDHPLNVMKEISRDVHHPHPGEVHQHVDVTSKYP